MRWPMVFLFTGLTCFAGPASAQQMFDSLFAGKWGVSQAECRDEEGPNLNTFISSTMLERYEVGCHVDRMRRSSATWTLDMTCKAEEETIPATAKLTLVGGDKLQLEQVSGGSRRTDVLIRCEQTETASQDSNTIVAQTQSNSASCGYFGCGGSMGPQRAQPDKTPQASAPETPASNEAVLAQVTSFLSRYGSLRDVTDEVASEVERLLAEVRSRKQTGGELGVRLWQAETRLMGLRIDVMREHETAKAEHRLAEQSSRGGSPNVGRQAGVVIADPVLARQTPMPSSQKPSFAETIAFIITQSRADEWTVASNKTFQRRIKPLGEPTPSDYMDIASFGARLGIEAEEIEILDQQNCIVQHRLTYERGAGDLRLKTVYQTYNFNNLSGEYVTREGKVLVLHGIKATCSRFLRAQPEQCEDDITHTDTSLSPSNGKIERIVKAYEYLFANYCSPSQAPF
jgi:hypothetical protein